MARAEQLGTRGRPFRASRLSCLESALRRHLTFGWGARQSPTGTRPYVSSLNRLECDLPDDSVEQHPGPSSTDWPEHACSIAASSTSGQLGVTSRWLKS